MTTLIKIDRKSIKKNPNAGRSSYRVQGPTTITFEIKGCVPKEFEDKVYVINECYNISGRGTGQGFIMNEKIIQSQSGHIDDLDVALEFMQWAKRKENRHCELKINIDSPTQTIYGMPEAPYFYGYDYNVLVECNSCYAVMAYANIRKDENDEGEDWDVCPNCHEINTFDYKFENINDLKL